MGWLMNSKFITSLTKHEVFAKTIAEVIIETFSIHGIFSMESASSRKEFANTLKTTIRGENSFLADDQLQTDDPLVLLMSIITYRIRCKLPYYTITDDDAAGITIKTVQYIQFTFENIEKARQSMVMEEAKKRESLFEEEKQRKEEILRQVRLQAEIVEKERKEQLAKDVLMHEFSAIKSKYLLLEPSEKNISIFYNQNSNFLNKKFAFECLDDFGIFCKIHYDYSVVLYNNKQDELAKKSFSKLIGLFKDYQPVNFNIYFNDNIDSDLYKIYINSIKYGSLIHYNNKEYSSAISFINRYMPYKLIQQDSDLRKFYENCKLSIMAKKEFIALMFLTISFVMAYSFFDKGFAILAYVLSLVAATIVIYQIRPANLSFSKFKYLLTRSTSQSLMVFIILAVSVATIFPDKIYTIIGDTFRDLKRHNIAMYCYNKAIQANPEYSTAYNNRGVSLYRTSNFTSAIEDYNSALKLKKSGITTKNKGIALAYLGKGKEAHENFIESRKQGIEIDNNELCAEISQNCKDGTGLVCESLKYFGTAGFCNPDLFARLFPDFAKPPTSEQIPSHPNTKYELSNIIDIQQKKINPTIKPKLVTVTKPNSILKTQETLPIAQTFVSKPQEVVVKPHIIVSKPQDVVVKPVITKRYKSPPYIWEDERGTGQATNLIINVPENKKYLFEEVASH